MPPSGDIEVFYDDIAAHRRPQFTLDGHQMTIPVHRVVPEPRMSAPFPVHTETPKMPMRFGDMLREKEKNFNNQNFWERLRRSFRNSFPRAGLGSLATVNSYPL